MSLDEKLVRTKPTVGASVGAGMCREKSTASHEMSRDGMMTMTVCIYRSRPPVIYVSTQCMDGHCAPYPFCFFAGTGRDTVRPDSLRVKTYLKPENKNKPKMRKKLAEHRACT